MVAWLVHLCLFELRCVCQAETGRSIEIDESRRFPGEERVTTGRQLHNSRRFPVGQLTAHAALTQRVWRKLLSCDSLRNCLKIRKHADGYSESVATCASRSPSTETLSFKIITPVRRTRTRPPYCRRFSFHRVTENPLEPQRTASLKWKSRIYGFLFNLVSAVAPFVALPDPNANNFVSKCRRFSFDRSFVRDWTFRYKSDIYLVSFFFRWFSPCHNGQQLLSISL